MEICTGVKEVETLKKYIEAGATEFYCGVIDDTWLGTYNYIAPLNRRPWPEANFHCFNDFGEAVRIVHAHGLKIFYTLNEHIYNEKQQALLMKHLEELIRLEVDAIIVADPGILKLIRENGFQGELHISTGGIAFNHAAVEFYQEQFGVKRIVLPRALSIHEINDITMKYPETDFEIFIKNEGCTFIDGVCNFIHGVQYVKKDNMVYNPPCELRYRILKANGKGAGNEEVLKNRLNRVQGSKANCGVCSLYLFHRDTIKSLKVVSRDSNPDMIVRDIKLVHRAIQLCEECSSFEEYKKEIRQGVCINDYTNKNIHCYYPEVIQAEEGR